MPNWRTAMDGYYEFEAWNYGGKNMFSPPRAFVGTPLLQFTWIQKLRNPHSD